MVKLFEILNFLKVKNKTYNNLVISKPSSIIPGKKNSISFIQKIDDTFGIKIKKTKSLIIVIPKSNKNFKSDNKILIAVENPRLEFCKIIESFFNQDKQNYFNSDSTIHPDAKISKNVSIGPFSYIGKSIIKENVVIHPNVTIFDNVTIKENSVIGAGSVIGSEGFGFQRDKASIQRFIHIGGVKIGKNVRIGSNNSIDRGALENTIIKNNVKTDNNVHIAHNCIIEEATMIAAGTTLSGSVRIGKNTWVGTGVTIRDHIKIGKNAFIGVGSVVVKNVQCNQMVYGVPAKKK